MSLKNKLLKRYFSSEIKSLAGIAYAKGYGDAGASHVKRALKGFTAQSGNTFEDIDLNNMTIRQRSRMLYMSTPLAASAINTNRTKIVGSGLRMRPAVNREAVRLSEESAAQWCKKVEAEWRLWSENRAACDALGCSNFYELQQLAVKSWLMSGDVFVLIKRGEPSVLNPYTLRLQLIEADRVSTPPQSGGMLIGKTEGVNPENGNAIHDGVEVDDSGRVVAYHICNQYPNAISAKVPEWVRVEAVGRETGLPNILHIMDAERPEQYRGVSYLAPVIESVLQLRRYTESELTAAIIQTCITAWVTTQEKSPDFFLEEVGAGDPPGAGIDDVSHDKAEYEMGAGTVNMLNPGEDVKFGNPNVPTAGFDNFVKAISRMIGSALELPYDILTKEFNSSYSAAKGALEEAWEAIKMRRSWFVSDFCRPIYEIWLAEAVAIGRVNAPGFFYDPAIRASWSGSRWDGPAQTHLDPVKEANANAILVSHGWKTNEQVTREFYGGDWSENAETVRQERGKLPQENKTETEVKTDEE